MKSALTQQQIQSYQTNGYLLVDNFLNEEELSFWRNSVTEAIEERNGRKFAFSDSKVGEEDGINKDSDYYGKVFDQMLNLWQTNDDVKKIMLDENIGKVVADLAGWEGTRIWHDQALIKRPWANPTSYHTTTFENPGIGKNMDAIFEMYPQFLKIKSTSVPMKAGSCSFHNGLTIHGAGANMTNGFRRAMTCAYMPDGAKFNGIKNILTDEQVGKLTVGDLLNDELQNPLIYSKPI